MDANNSFLTVSWLSRIFRNHESCFSEPNAAGESMKVIKHGEQRLFETDAETATVVTRMLLELERDGMDAVRRYSLQFDEWAPASFRLSEQQIAEAIAQVSEQAIRDTDYCQGNVRKFAQAQLATLAASGSRDSSGSDSRSPAHSGELGGELYPGWPISDVRIGPDEHHSGACRRGETYCRLHAPGERAGLLSRHDQCHSQSGRRLDLRSGRRAGSGLDGFRSGWKPASGCALWSGKSFCRGSEETAVRSLWDRPAGRTHRDSRDCRRRRGSCFGRL